MKTILNTGLSSQNDLQSLEESLQNINSIIEDFQSLTNTNTGHQISINLRQRIQILTDTSEQCEYYTRFFQQINQLSEGFLQSIAQVEQQPKNAHVNQSVEIIPLTFSFSP